VHWKTDGTQENPDNDMRTAILAAGDDAGIVPNRAVYGLGAWAQRQACYEAQNNYGGAYIPAGYTVQQLAAKLLLDAIMVFTPRYQSSVSAKSRILNLEAIAFFAQPGVTQEDPSNLKRFISPTEGGTPFRIYIKEHAKFTEIMVEHYCYTVLCDSQGIQALTIDES
jgi:hypothetical protein